MCSWNLSHRDWLLEVSQPDTAVNSDDLVIALQINDLMAWQITYMYGYLYII